MKELQGVSQPMMDCFGSLAEGFVMLIWGQSSNGKSEFTMQMVRELTACGRVLYVGLEEGHGESMQQRVMRNLTPELHNGKVEFADHTMTYPELVKKLSKRNMIKTIVIDSLQYWNISYLEYQRLKEANPKRNFIFISHASGKYPKGSTADAVRYDAGVKVYVDKFIAFITSRYGGHLNHVIYEERARQRWGAKEFKKHLKQ